MRFLNTMAIAAMLSMPAVAWSQSNIDATDKSAWCENAGWTNWRDASAASQGVNFGPRIMEGYIWGENIGWIGVGDGTPTNGSTYSNVGGDDAGVNVDAQGHMYGLAWAENAGWINFGGGALASPPQPARVECDGRLNGFVWSENLGWLTLSAHIAGKRVALDQASVSVACDLNHDGDADADDIQRFMDVVFAGAVDWRDVCSGDLTIPPDRQLDSSDMTAFVSCLLNE